MPKKPKWNEQPCPACKEPAAADATVCPHCRTAFTPEQVDARKKTHASITKAGSFGCLGIIAVLVLVSMCSGPEENASGGGGSPTAASGGATQGSAAVAAAKAVVEDPASKLTGPQRNAVRTAEQYINMTGFSRDGLIDQLSSDAGEGYERADAIIAVDSLTVDWNEQAARSAKQYLEMSGFSCKGLIDQLSSSSGEQFTKSQATYGAKQAGAC